MKLLIAALVSLHVAAPAAPLAKITDFELTDQDEKLRTYRFPKAKVTVMTVADHKGSEQLAPWIQRIRDRYETRIDIDGVADVSIVPKILHGMIRDTFRKKLTYSVMLDWDGNVLAVRPAARSFVRTVAAAFDAYFEPQAARHARAI